MAAKLSGLESSDQYFTTLIAGQDKELLAHCHWLRAEVEKQVLQAAALGERGLKEKGLETLSKINEIVERFSRQLSGDNG